MTRQEKKRRAAKRAAEELRDVVLQLEVERGRLHRLACDDELPGPIRNLISDRERDVRHAMTRVQDQAHLLGWAALGAGGAA